jgi:hypothetical protein
MNATSVLVLILVLSFATDRLVKGLLFLLAQIPPWARRFPDPRLIADKQQQIVAADRTKLIYAVLVALIAGAAVIAYQDLRIIRMLSGPQVPRAIDVLVTVIVVMGGSDLVSRILQISGMGEIGAGTAGTGQNQPVEISGRLVLESPASPQVTA